MAKVERWMIDLGYVPIPEVGDVVEIRNSPYQDKVRMKPQQGVVRFVSDVFANVEFAGGFKCHYPLWLVIPLRYLLIVIALSGCFVEAGADFAVAYDMYCTIDFIYEGEHVHDEVRWCTTADSPTHEIFVDVCDQEGVVGCSVECKAVGLIEWCSDPEDNWQ